MPYPNVTEYHSAPPLHAMDGALPGAKHDMGGWNRAYRTTLLLWLLLQGSLPAPARASVAFYNTRQGVDALVAGMHRVIEVFGV